MNHGRTRTPSISTGRGSKRPLGSTAPDSHNCSKSSANARASTAGRTTAITFSWRVQDSSVQFVEPVKTVSPSRTTYLWCIRSGTPAIGFAGTPSDAISAPSGSGGGGTGTGSRTSAFHMNRTATPRAAASRTAPPTSTAVSAPRLKS